MNKYLCMYNRKSIEIDADTSFHAQQLAFPIIYKMYKPRKIKPWDIVVILVEINGQPIITSTNEV